MILVKHNLHLFVRVLHFPPSWRFQVHSSRPPTLLEKLPFPHPPPPPNTPAPELSLLHPPISMVLSLSGPAEHGCLHTELLPCHPENSACCSQAPGLKPSSFLDAPCFGGARPLWKDLWGSSLRTFLHSHSECHQNLRHNSFPFSFWMFLEFYSLTTSSEIVWWYILLWLQL